MDVDLNSTNVLFTTGGREWCLGIRIDLFVRHKVETMYLENTAREAQFEQYSCFSIDKCNSTRFSVLLRCR